MRDDYLREASKLVDDPNILVNVVSRRVKQLRHGARPLVESLEKLSAEDTALREIMEGKISYELAADEIPAVLNDRAAFLRNVRSMPADPAGRKSARAAKAEAAAPAIEASIS
jgi:DNA-directed RNA polymerase subunit omega